MRKDKDNKADAHVTKLMQIKDQAIIEERNLALFKLKNKEMSAVTEIKDKDVINTTNQLSVKLQDLCNSKGVKDTKAAKPRKENMLCRALKHQMEIASAIQN
jgi:hypothetical protein